MSRPRALVTAACLTLASTAAASGGVVLTMETSASAADSAPPRTSTLSVDGLSLRLDAFTPAGEPEGSMIFDGESKTLTAIDHAKKSVIEIDENVVVGMDERMRNAMGRAHEQAKRLPPGQREAMQKILEDRLAASRPGPAAIVEVRRTDERETLDGRPARKHVVIRDGRTVREVWTTPWSRIEGGAELRPALRGLVEFVDRLQAVVDRLLTGAGGSLSIAHGPFAQLERLDGFPVLATTIENGRETLRTTFRSSRRSALDPSTFSPPDGYRSRIVRD